MTPADNWKYWSALGLELQIGIENCAAFVFLSTFGIASPVADESMISSSFLGCCTEARKGCNRWAPDGFLRRWAVP